MSLSAALAPLLVRRLWGPSAAWLTPVMSAALPGIGMVLATSLAAAMLGLVPPFLTKLLIDRGLVAQDWDAVVRYAGLTFAVGLVLLASSIGNSLLHLHYSARMLVDLRARLFHAVLHRRPAAAALPVGEALTRLDGDTAEIQRFSFDTLLTAASSVFRLAGAAGMLFFLDWRLALIPLAAAPLNLAFLAWVRPGTQRRAEAVRESRGALTSYLAESLGGLPTLRTLAAQDRRSDAFSPLQADQVALLLRQRGWTELVGAVPQITAALVRIAILLGGGLLVVRGEWQIGALIAFLTYVGMMTGPLQNLLGLYHAQARARVALDRLSAVADPDVVEAGGRTPAPGPGALRFVHARGESGQHLPVDLTIRPGELVLIDGPSGIGKSVLAGLASALSRPAAGARVFLDGEDVVGLHPAALRRAVAVVPQAATLFRGTVGDNLRLADPAAGPEAIANVLNDAAVGLDRDAMIAEGGRNLSGGERQRLALARALLLPFRVLILDECLSEVDASTAQRILAAIRGRHPHCTILVIAHSGPARGLAFDQVVTLRPDPALRSARGEAPNQRENARENAV